jgi:hypothetical protein
MALREFIDESGRLWTVWDVRPELVERRLRNAGPPVGMRERRIHARRRALIPSGMAQGWLAFESDDGDRRRLAPIPNVPRAWSEASDRELRVWCAMAQPMPRSRRLIE